MSDKEEKRYQHITSVNVNDKKLSFSFTTGPREGKYVIDPEREDSRLTLIRFATDKINAADEAVMNVHVDPSRARGSSSVS